MAANVPVEAVHLLWKDHFAIGKISLVAAPANVGKSPLAAGDFVQPIMPIFIVTTTKTPAG